ncbi:MAG: (2Fe-2S)-binding protein [Puniceicoccales bacterium]|jgi:NADH-quinone oxidoreductase subunit G|nr:(2Fe-2S)-binding protein [Puniceicoccales bacterium]
MSSAAPASNITITVDGRELSVPAGARLIDALDAHGLRVPRLCYHAALSVAGNCRLCLVETGAPAKDATGGVLRNADGSPQIRWSPKPSAACATTVSPGLHVRLDSPLARDCRAGTLEFLLANHPLDCPICDKAGECDLQNFAAANGRRCSRYSETKLHKPKNLRTLGPRLVYDAERCVLCGRCVRFCAEILKKPVLSFIKRGAKAEISTAAGHPLDSNYSLNTVDLCPVGALTDAAFRFQMRVWFLRKTPSICVESSTGVNTWVWHREGKILRITPRRNDAVNGCWMTDSGRARHLRIHAPDRTEEYLRNGLNIGMQRAVSAVQGALTDAAARGKLAVVLSSFLTVEEMLVLRKLLNNLGGNALKKKVFLPARTGEADGFLLTADRTPNTAGAWLTGLFDRKPETKREKREKLTKILAAGDADTVLLFRENIIKDTETGQKNTELEEILKKNKTRVIYFTTHTDDMALLADIVLPALTVFEKSGSYVNSRARLQKFEQVIAPVGNTPIATELEVLARVAGEDALTTPDAVWQRAASDESFTTPEFRAAFATGNAATGGDAGADAGGKIPCCIAEIPANGLQLNGADWLKNDHK